MSDLEQFEKEWDKYKNSAQTEENKQTVLEQAKKNPSNMWAVFFLRIVTCPIVY